MKDRRGFERGCCRLCECSEFELNPNESTHKCFYCDHLSMEHRNLDSLDNQVPGPSTIFPRLISIEVVNDDPVDALNSVASKPVSPDGTSVMKRTLRKRCRKGEKIPTVEKTGCRVVTRKVCFFAVIRNSRTTIILF
jgi:hypothetical protein